MRSARPHAKAPPAVFIADDSAVARLALARRLRAEGFEVVEQASAQPPEEETAARVFCALLDVELGEGDGSDVARALRAHRAELPVAFFSGSASASTLARARAFGPVFAKPAELEAAIAWVKEQTS
jgi:CheY-like chemotaxis protein